MNAKQEFLSKVNGHTVICAILQEANFCSFDEAEKPWCHILKKGYSEEDYNKFLQEIDFEYNNGYGGQEIDGVIWLSDGAWYDRGEYDGSEWWEFHKYPEIPENLK